MAVASMNENECSATCNESMIHETKKACSNVHGLACMDLYLLFHGQTFWDDPYRIDTHSKHAPCTGLLLLLPMMMAKAIIPNMGKLSNALSLSLKVCPYSIDGSVVA